MSDGAMDVIVGTSSREAVARRWADAKAALEQADQALALAKAEYAKCEDAEFHAWQELEALAGRPSLRTTIDTQLPQGQLPATYRTGDGIFAQQAAQRHSLPVKPIG